MVESQPSKLLVAGSIPVSRSILRSPLTRLEMSAAADVPAAVRSAKADVAQLAERVLGKDEVTGSIPVIGSSLRSLGELWLGRPYQAASRAKAVSPKRVGGPH